MLHEGLHLRVDRVSRQAGNVQSHDVTSMGLIPGQQDEQQEPVAEEGRTLGSFLRQQPPRHTMGTTGLE